jgi:hypothetical protein
MSCAELFILVTRVDHVALVDANMGREVNAENPDVLNIRAKHGVMCSAPLSQRQCFQFVSVERSSNRLFVSGSNGMKYVAVCGVSKDDCDFIGLRKGSISPQIPNIKSV